jgi:hypothetical protein
LPHDVFIKWQLVDDISIYLHRPSVTDARVAPKDDDRFYSMSRVSNLNGKTVCAFRGDPVGDSDLIRSLIPI